MNFNRFPPNYHNSKPKLVLQTFILSSPVSMHFYVYLFSRTSLDCGTPVVPTDGNVTLAISGVTTYGAVAIYACAEGYDISGDETVVCNSSGSWSRLAVCQIKGSRL